MSHALRYDLSDINADKPLVSTFDVQFQEVAINQILDEHRTLMELDSQDVLLFKSLEHSFVINLLFKSVKTASKEFSIHFIEFIEQLIEKQRERHCPVKACEVVFLSDYAPKLDSFQATALGIFLYEIVHNTFLNSFSAIEKPRFEVQFKDLGNEIEFWISDNGSGFTQTLHSNEPSRIGLQVLRIIESQLNAELFFIQKGGTSIGLRFKKESVCN